MKKIMQKTIKFSTFLIPLLLLGACFEGTQKSVEIYTGGKSKCPLSNGINYNILQMKNGKETSLGRISINEDKNGKCALIGAQGLNYETSNVVTQFITMGFSKLNDDNTYLSAKKNIRTNNYSLIFVKIARDGRIGFYTDCRNKAASTIIDKIGITRNNNECTLSEISQYYKLADEISNLKPDIVLVPNKL